MLKIKFKKNFKIWSSKRKKTAAKLAKAKTIKDPVTVSFFVGQVILKASCLTSCKNLKGFFIILFSGRSGGNRTPNLRFWRPALYQLSYTPSSLLYNFGHYSSTNCFTAFPNSKIQFFAHGYRSNKFNIKFCIISRHNHFCSRW